MGGSEDSAKNTADAAKKGVLHQTRNLPFSPIAMAVGGFAIVGVIAYFTLYVKKKPDATAGDVVKVATNTSDSTSPRK